MHYNKIIRKLILEYYKKNKRDLPWRTLNDNDQNPYHTLVSEIMLQQTQVNKVVNYYKIFIKKWPNIMSLAEAKLEEVFTIWSGLGYYRRAKYLHDLAVIIKTNFKGEIPKDKKVLIKLPGIGEYTSNAIISFSFNQFSIPLDTNIKRFIIRIFGIDEGLYFDEKKLVHYGRKLYPLKKSGKFTQAIMDFSASICKKKPICEVCFLSKYCKYKNKNQKNKYIIKKNKIKKKYSLAYFYLFNKKLFLLKKRPLNKILGGLYEVPSSSWLSNDWPKVSYKFSKFVILPKVLTHKFSHLVLNVKVIFVEVRKKELKEKDVIWIKSDELKRIPTSSLTEKIVSYSLSELNLK